MSCLSVNLAIDQLSDFEAGVGRAEFERDGCALLEGFFAPHRIDRAGSAVQALLAQRPQEVVADSLQTGRRTFWSQAEHPESRHFRFNDLYLMSAEIRDLALDPDLAAVLSEQLGEPPVLCGSHNFEKGSSQPKRIDSLYMTPRTPHRLITAWVALEDVHPDSGPLAYFPGSHRIPLYTFNDGSHHATRDEILDWFDYIDVQLRLRGLRERRLLARKGDVFIGHADLVHGGSPIADFGRTCRCLVCHYFGAADCNERGLDIVPSNGGYWLARLRAPVFVDPAAFGPGFPFPEESYLRRYPDVREAVEANLCPSGEHHYRIYGFEEGRGV
jgi:phytanoyl-CoA hydroxylase